MDNDNDNRSSPFFDIAENWGVSELWEFTQFILLSRHQFCSKQIVPMLFKFCEITKELSHKTTMIFFNSENKSFNWAAVYKKIKINEHEKIGDSISTLPNRIFYLNTNEKWSDFVSNAAQQDFWMWTSDKRMKIHETK